jgi:hypothetical protein
MSALPRWRIFGVDFTSRPRPRKPITIAGGHLDRHAFVLDTLEEHSSWEHFETWLRRPGTWIAGFDFPFGLPRQAVVELGWPRTYAAMARHCRGLGRDGFRGALDRYRESRPVGKRYAHRAADLPARSHSPLKLVNPPVGLMFLEGVPRLLDAGVAMPGLCAGDPARVALEAYPGFTARQICRDSYKSDAVTKQTPARRHARRQILDGLMAPSSPFGFKLKGPAPLLDSLLRDASGDRLDAALCAMQAAWALKRREQNYGMPANGDPLEGWILTVPWAGGENEKATA